MYPASCRWPQRPKRYRGRLQTVAGRGETRRQTLFVQACAQLISRVPSPKGTLLQRGACRFRVRPPGQHLARSLSYCAARERVGSVYAGDRDAIRQVQALFDLWDVKNGDWDPASLFLFLPLHAKAVSHPLFCVYGCTFFGICVAYGSCCLQFWKLHVPICRGKYLAFYVYIDRKSCRERIWPGRNKLIARCE